MPSCARCDRSLFSAVGQWYHDFSATSDDDVLHLLAAHHRPV